MNGAYGENLKKINCHNFGCRQDRVVVFVSILRYVVWGRPIQRCHL